MQEVTLGPQHREVANTHHNLALLLRAQGNSQKAIQMCSEAIRYTHVLIMRDSV